MTLYARRACTWSGEHPGALSAVAATLVFAAGVTWYARAEKVAPDRLRFPRCQISATLTATSECWHELGLAVWRIRSTRPMLGVVQTDIEITRLQEARLVARQLLDEFVLQEDEVLIYFRLRGDTAPRLRIRWTPRGGIEELPLE